MRSLVRRWSFPAAILTAAFALTACAGNNGSPVPSAPNQMSPTGLYNSGAQLHGMASEGVPAAAPKCPTSIYLQCFTVSLKNGLVINWCDGTKKEPCIDTKKFTWSGDVCKATSSTCGPIKQMTAAWTGPFPCSKHPKNCVNMTKKGYYETDTISIGSPPPKKTKQYVYKQEIELDSAEAAYIGLNVGP